MVDEVVEVPEEAVLMVAEPDEEALTATEDDEGATELALEERTAEVEAGTDDE